MTELSRDLDMRRDRIMQVLQRLDALTLEMLRVKNALADAVVILFGQEDVPQLRTWKDDQGRLALEQLRRTCPEGAEDMLHLVERRWKEARTEKGLSATEHHVGCIIERLSKEADACERPCADLENETIAAVEAQLKLARQILCQQ